MSLGRAAISVETPLDLAAACDQVRREGGSLPFTLLEPTMWVSADTLPRVVHLDAAGDASAKYASERRILEVRASIADLTAVDLIFLSYLLLETELQRLGFVTLHGAAVEREGRAVVLLGHSGAGKTTTAVALCRDFGCQLIGNDLVIVGGLAEPLAISGTTHIRLRYSSVRRSLPELAHLFDSDAPDPWRTKKDIAPEDLGVSVSERQAAVVGVVFVHIDNDYAQRVVAPGNTWIHRNNLYENALRHIRATATPWLIGEQRQFGPFVPSLDDADIHTARTATLDRLLRRSHYVAGSLRDVAGYASDLLAPTASSTTGAA